MDQRVEELINDCVHLQHEIGLLAPIILLLSPLFNVENKIKPNISDAEQLNIRDKLEQFSSAEKVKMEYMLNMKALENKLSNLAELLEEEEFDLGKFGPRLSEDQFNWLVSHKKEIKKHLRGIQFK